LREFFVCDVGCCVVGYWLIPRPVNIVISLGDEVSLIC